MRRFLPLLLLPLLAAAAAARAQSPDAAPSYLIGPKDRLEIRVFEEPTLNVEVRVSERGSVNLPLLGEFPVEGLTEEQAAVKLKAELEESYLQRATVSLRVTEFRSRPISVLGAVNKPGNLELLGRWTLLEALTDAGGLAAEHGNVVHVRRRASNGLSDRLTIDLDDLMAGGDSRYNIPLLANDVVIVPSASDVRVFFIGEVQRAGAVSFKSTDQATLLTAIAQAGGLTERAGSKISVKRLRADGTREEIVVNYKQLLSGKTPDLVLRDQDLIVIKESFF